MMQTFDTEPQDPYKQEVTLRDVILQATEYIKVCLANWKLIAICVGLGLAIQFYRYQNTYATYKASVTFMVNEAKGASIGGLLGSLNTIVGEKDEKYYKILELARSRRLMTAALFKKTTIGGVNDFYANHLIRVEGYHAEWKKDTAFANFLFSHGEVTKFTGTENQVLKQLYYQMIGSETVKDPLFAANVKEVSGILSIAFKCRDMDLAIAMANNLYFTLSDYYVESTIRRELETYNVLAAKRDSIEALLNSNDIAGARHSDQTYGLISNVDRVPGKRYQRNSAILTTMYTEIIKNSEIAEFALKTSTPYITLIDEPIPPIKPSRTGLLKMLVIGIVAGLGLSVTYILVRHLIQDALKK